MGLLVDGKWQDKWYDTKSTGGRFKRSESQFRNWVTADGSAGPSGDSGFQAESGRYHLYVSYACPWAHRTLIVRALKGLQDHIGVSVVHPHMLENGWELRDDFDGASGDALYGFSKLYELYLKADDNYTGRVTVPVLWDTQRETIVSNESAEIIRMLNTSFDDLGAAPGNFYPEVLQAEIDAINERVYNDVNNGVYKAGFATTQAAYDEAIGPLFETLDWLEDRLSAQRYVMGHTLTEVDWRLFTTLVRFDLVYHGHFKCNRARIVDYPNLWAYLRELFQWPGVAATVDLGQISRHYHYSQGTVNPHRIVPIGPQIDFTLPHNREAAFAPA